MNKDRKATPKIEQLHTNHLVAGMEIARDVFCDDGNNLVSAGTIISNHTIKKMKKWNIKTVSIVSEVAENPIVDPKLQQFVNSYNKSVSVVQKAFDDIRATQTVQLDAFAATAEELAESAVAAGNIVDRLYNLPTVDDNTFQHSVNVGVIAALIATWLNYPVSVVNAVSLAGLLHDVGKAKLPVEILNQPNKLSAIDYELYKKHVVYSLELIRDLPDLAESVKAGILGHHERTDGSGYPFKLTADKIHPYASIVAIADLYDEALTINRDPSVVCSPYHGLERLDDVKHSVDPEICLMFMDRMLNFLSGNIVALNDGSQGRVVCLNRQQPSRSIVQLTDGTVLDLVEQTKLRIDYVIR